jgi:hypothetical protein
VVERSESHYLRASRLGALEEAKPKLVRDEGPTDLFRASSPHSFFRRRGARAESADNRR